MPSSLQEGYLGAVLGVFGVKKSPEKRGFHSRPKDASSAYLFFIGIGIGIGIGLGTGLGLGIGIGIGIGITELVSL